MAFDYKKMLKKELNLGEKDILIRRSIGIACVVLSVLPGSVPMLLIGIVLIGSATIRWCPVYSGLHKNTHVS
ncbi:MAG TPA: DUF2892 domain-containing protein [Crenotrichaceae bacterium]|nr:DUF2892 domain-containing protein [Crenotrichaceae bacterium]